MSTRAHLLPLTPAHERRLGALVVDIRPQVLELRLGRRLRLLDRLVHRRLRLLVDPLQVVLAREPPLLDVAHQPADRVLRTPHPLDLLARAVRRARVRHRVPAVAVRDELEQQRALARRDPLARVAHALHHRDDVHPVHLQAGDGVATREVGRVGRGALRGGAHPVLVVLADKHAGEVPEFSLGVA